MAENRRLGPQGKTVYTGGKVNVYVQDSHLRLRLPAKWTKHGGFAGGHMLPYILFTNVCRFVQNHARGILGLPWHKSQILSIKSRGSAPGALVDFKSDKKNF